MPGDRFDTLSYWILDAEHSATAAVDNHSCLSTKPLRVPHFLPGFLASPDCELRKGQRRVTILQPQALRTLEDDPLEAHQLRCFICVDSVSFAFPSYSCLGVMVDGWLAKRYSNPSPYINCRLTPPGPVHQRRKGGMQLVFLQLQSPQRDYGLIDVLVCLSGRRFSQFRGW